MKKIGLLVLIMMASLSTLFAQRIAVLEFKAGTGINDEFTKALTQSFSNAFRIGESSVVSVVEQPELNETLAKHGYNKSQLSNEEKLNLSETYEWDKIVSGEVNLADNQFELVISAFDKKLAADMITDTIRWEKTSDYNEVMKDLSKSFTSKVSVASIMFDVMMKTLRQQLGFSKQ